MPTPSQRAPLPLGLNPVEDGAEAGSYIHVTGPAFLGRARLGRLAARAPVEGAFDAEVENLTTPDHGWPVIGELERAEFPRAEGQRGRRSGRAGRAPSARGRRPPRRNRGR